MRLKYPHLVVGALSSSGPVQPLLDYKGSSEPFTYYCQTNTLEYYGIAADDLRTNSPACFDETKSSFDQ
jgi:hypothetical protein